MGKWRPSAEAKRLGKTAITLERLLTRDGFTFEEAVKILTTPSGGQYTVSELEAIYVRLPPHNPRPILISDDASADAVAVEADADDRAQRADRERTARRLTTALDSVVKTMDAEDRVILQLRFWDGCKVPDIARTLHIDPKKLYKRLEKIFDRLRRALEAAGLDRMEIATLLAHGDQEIDLGILPREIGRSGPSHPNGRGSQRRRRRLP